MGERTILITGCSSGIGHDAAHGLARQGWRVLATCRKVEDCARLKGEGLESFALDYADEASIKAAVEEAARRTDGRIDALFNNGAFACPGAVEDLPRGALREIFETNLFGLHELTCRVIPLMREQGHGRIVNCSSVLGFTALKWRGAYVASKFALEGLTDTLRLEMRGHPIEVVLIQPGPIASRIRENSIPHFERWVDWQNSARAAEYRAGLLRRLYKSSAETRFQLPPEAVTQVLARALDARRPRARYQVTVPTRIAAAARRLLPDGWRDSMLSGS